MKTIKITQELEQTGNASYIVNMTITDGEDEQTQEFRYNNCNRVYPLFNSLINALDAYEGVHIELTTNYKRFAEEVNGNPNKNSRMLEILSNIKERRNITIDAE